MDSYSCDPDCTQESLHDGFPSKIENGTEVVCRGEFIVVEITDDETANLLHSVIERRGL